MLFGVSVSSHSLDVAKVRVYHPYYIVSKDEFKIN